MAPRLALEPVSASVLAALLLGEPLTAPVVVGGLAVRGCDHGRPRGPSLVSPGMAERRSHASGGWVSLPAGNRKELAWQSA